MARRKNDDLIGKRFGQLLVTKRVDNWGGHITYECLCDCGRTRIIKGTYLSNGKRTSCGHEREATVPNEYDLSGEYGICYMRCKKDKFIFDKEDYDILKQYHWFVNNNGYAMAYTHRKSYFSHRIIMNCPDDLVVDHINHITLDNRKNNLRVCTQKDNVKNKVTPKSNKSGYKGVFQAKSTGHWLVYLGNNGERKYIGCYTNKEDAIDARKKAEIEYYGEFANLERS